MLSLVLESASANFSSKNSFKVTKKSFRLYGFVTKVFDSFSGYLACDCLEFRANTVLVI